MGNNADAQIQAHRQAHQQKLKKMLLIIATVILLIVVIIVVSQLISSASSNNSENQSDNAAVISLSEQQIAQYRDAFKQSLTEYQISVQPKIDAMILANWRTADTGAVTLLKEQVLTFFAQGAYAESKAKLDKLIADSNLLVDEWQNEIAQHLSTAQAMFDKEKMPAAQLALNKAIALQSDNQEAEALQNRINAFSEIELLLNDLRVAKVERNLPKQIDLLTDIIDLDPNRNELNQDLRQAKAEYDQQQLAKVLAQAQGAIDSGQLNRAQEFILQAKAIKSDSKGADALQTKINQMQAEQGLSQTKKTLQQLVKADDWQAVASLAKQARVRFANDTDLIAFEQKAVKVLSAKRALAIFVAKPNRLADQNIRDAAQSAIQQAFSASLLSPSLQADIMQVANTIDAYASKVDVTISSDGNTYIVVVGVGHVGQHKEKVIQLTPGKYTLQGQREGYRNKRLQLEISANGPTTFTLVCDEKIN